MFRTPTTTIKALAPFQYSPEGHYTVSVEEGEEHELPDHLLAWVLDSGLGTPASDPGHAAAPASEPGAEYPPHDLVPKDAQPAKPSILEAADRIDDFTRIKGIRPKTAKDLNKAGIVNFFQLLHTAKTKEGRGLLDSIIGRVCLDDALRQAGELI